MDRIRELLERISELSSEELDELRDAILAEGDKLDGEPNTPEVVKNLNELAEAAEKVAGEQSARVEREEAAEQEAAAARERLHGLRPAEDGDGKDGKDADGEDAEQESDDEDAGSAEGEESAEGQVASGRIRKMHKGKITPSPERDQEEPNRAVLTASGALRGVDPSKPLTDRYELGTAMANTLRRMTKQGAPRGDVLLASATWEYPEERQLGEDETENARKIDAVTHPTALTASGGICAPVNVDYTIPTWATAERPLRDGLPAFQATRGGIRFVTPPDFGALAGATTIWTEATDAEPGEATKPVIHISCGSQIEVLVDAIPTRLGFGNMQGAFSPEQVAANTDLAVAAAARIAENNILAKLEALSTKNVTWATAVLGATRDLITQVHQLTAAYRYVHRIGESQRFTMVMPYWIRELIKIDLARELAHDNSGSFNVLEISDEQVDQLFSAHGINPVYHIDGQAESAGKYPLQGWTAQSAETAIKAFPSKMVWYLYLEGTVQFLDGGRLDLGVVRDSTLDATNDYETFVETFEGVAYRGFSGGLLQIVSTLCANGKSSATETVSTCA